MAPMGRSSAQDGVLSPAYAPYYARRAAGGAALIIGEATAVDHPTAMHMHTSSTIHGRGAEAWPKVAEPVHAAGGAFLPQLWHAGLMRSPYPAADPKLAMVNHHMKSIAPRTEERRVGSEWVSTGRSRWVHSTSKKHT